MSTQNTGEKFELSFSVHGIGIKVTSMGIDISEDIKEFAQGFPAQSIHASSDIEINLQAIPHLRDVPHEVLASKAKRHSVSRRTKTMGVVKRLKLNFSLFQDQDWMVVDFHEYGLILIDGPGGTAHGYLVQPDSMDPLIRAAFFNMSLFELFRWRGLFVIHGVALEHQGKGVLITGPPGRGKTTAGLSLLSAGYGFISDDFPFLRANGSKVELLSLHDWVDVREKSIRFFPELETITLAPRREGAKKESFSIPDLYPEAKVQSCQASIILFPKIVVGQNSTLEPMPKFQVMKELLPQGLQVHSQALAKREFQLYTRLVEQTPCYRLYFGENPQDLSQLVDTVLEQCDGV